MEKINSLIKEQKYFLILYAVLFLISVGLLINFSKAELHIAVNQCYNNFFDTFFYYITYLGDGLISITIGLLLLFYSIRSSLLVLASYALSGIFVQILKRLFFSGMQRPKAYFEGLYDLRFVKGLEIHTSNSFPSGHSATAFALFFSLAILTKNKLLQVFFLILAVLTAFSRVYLSQHFQVDITFGSFIGILIVISYYVWQTNWNAGWLDIPVNKINDYKRSIKS